MHIEPKLCIFNFFFRYFNDLDCPVVKCQWLWFYYINRQLLSIHVMVPSYVELTMVTNIFGRRWCLQAHQTHSFESCRGDVLEKFDIICLRQRFLIISRISIAMFRGQMKSVKRNLSNKFVVQYLFLKTVGRYTNTLPLCCLCRAISSYSIAVLHPRRLSIFTLTSTAGAVAHGAQYKLQHVYSHNLQRTAFNMCHGPFGKVQG